MYWSLLVQKISKEQTKVNLAQLRKMLSRLQVFHRVCHCCIIRIYIGFERFSLKEISSSTGFSLYDCFKGNVLRVRSCHVFLRSAVL